MNSTDKKMPLSTAATIAGAVGVVAFLLLKIVSGFGFFGALFLGLLVAIAVFGILLIAFVENSGGALGPGPDAATENAPPKPAAASSSASVAAAPVAPKAAPAAKAKPAAAPKPKPKPAKATAAKAAKPAAVPAADAGAASGTKPAVLSAPRAGGADNLKEIKGVGPKMEIMLNEMGFYHFDQVAAWTATEVAWVDENLKGFKGRVSRDSWVDQAKILAAGGETEFSKKVDKGGIY